jgi:hypothetical protein
MGSKDRDYTRICDNCGNRWLLPKELAEEKAPRGLQVSNMNRAARLAVTKGQRESYSMQALAFRRNSPAFWTTPAAPRAARRTSASTSRGRRLRPVPTRRRRRQSPRLSHRRRPLSRLAGWLAGIQTPAESASGTGTARSGPSTQPRDAAVIALGPARPGTSLTSLHATTIRLRGTT